MAETKTELVKIDSPKEVAVFANELKKFVVTNNLFSQVKGKNFVHVEGWQFAGASMGYFFIPVAIKSVSEDPKVYKYEATVEMVRISDGQVVGRGFALCSNQESTKKSFDEYAVYSMAQTRAIGKAGRNTLGWMMKLAGYEATPAEEMPDDTKMADAIETPITEIKDAVGVRMASLAPHEKMRILKTVNKLNDKDLTDSQYRQLYYELKLGEPA